MSFRDKVAEWSKQVMKSPGRVNQSITERAVELLHGYVNGSDASIDKEFRSFSQYLIGPDPNSTNLSRAAHVFAYLHENYNSTDAPSMREREIYQKWITGRTEREKQPESDYRNVIRELVDGFNERVGTGIHRKFEDFVIYEWGPGPSTKHIFEAASVFSFHETPTKGQPIPSTRQSTSYTAWKSWYGTNDDSSKAVPAKEDSPAKLKAIEAMKALTPDELGEVLDLFLLVNDGPETKEVPDRSSCSESSAGPTFTEFKTKDFRFGIVDLLNLVRLKDEFLKSWD